MVYLLVAFVILVGQLVLYTLGLNLCQIVYLASVFFFFVVVVIFVSMRYPIPIKGFWNMGLFQINVLISNN